MDYLFHLGDPAPLQHSPQPLDYPGSQVGGPGRVLADSKPAGLPVLEDIVGESSADVYSESISQLKLHRKAAKGLDVHYTHGIRKSVIPV